LGFKLSNLTIEGFTYLSFYMFLSCENTALEANGLPRTPAYEYFG